MGDAVDELIEEITVDAYGVDEQLWSFRQAFEDRARFPFQGRVVGASVDVVAVDFDGDEHGGLIAVCERTDERYAVALLEVVPDDSLSDQTRALIDAYRRWTRARPMPVADLDHQTPCPESSPVERSPVSARQRRESAPALDTLSSSEHADVLAGLLDAHSELRSEAEQVARTLLASVVIDEVADAVSSSLEAIPLDDLGARSGRIRGRGYVHETEAAWELVTEAVEPFVADLRRRARLGLSDAAAALSVGIVAGLYRLREPEDGTVVAYAGPDAPGDFASGVISEASQLGVVLPADVSDRYWPHWLDLD